ncbi:DUF5776 domain-containing protein [Apilactobacillus kunkeei]|uniref:glycoside hydrolase family 70 protein n=1 Tax=Apilactobacillus kunkeei TaxID=148814 RepID=UPI002659DB47|nr:glycoside hydrolase family 70 protein [Apilactobacillus kunkeei]MCX0326053.1 DUF5776 domain-containing protein [Apilactobacillus kunkeei]
MNSKDYNTKLHFKMYKSGKQWIVVGLTTAVISIAAYGDFSFSNGSIDAKADVQNAQQTSNSVSVISDDKTLDQNNQIASLPQDGKYVTSDNTDISKFVYQGKDIQGLYKDNDGQLKYFNEYDGTQAKGDIINVNNDNYYFDNSGQGHKIDSYYNGSYGEKTVNNKSGWVYNASDNNPVKGIATVDDKIQYFDPTTGLQLKGGSANVGGVNYYFEPNLGYLTGKVDQVVNSNDYSDNKLLDSNKNVVKGLTVNNGQLQYYDPSTGDQAKNKQVIANGVTYYFDGSGNGTYLFTNTGNSAVTDFSQHNAANSVNPSDYKNVVDGFFTADTWYRPKQILDNGTTWRNSNSNDFRPMITSWWPNKDVQVNYLNLMQNNGLLDDSVTYTLQSDQQVLNNAAQSAQVNIEKRISQTGSTDWLNNLLFSSNGNTPSFVKQQYVWNSDSESPWAGDAWFQGGYLKYSNSILTPNTNSNYRNSDNLFDFLLANDVDNSNPAVQAEDLNWLYYLTNFGTITANNKNANFDSIRIDAVDFISNDVIQRSYDYLRQKFNLTQSDANSNAHISLVEGGVDAGTTSYNNDGLVEAPFRLSAYPLLHKQSGDVFQDLINEVDSGIDISNHNGETNTTNTIGGLTLSGGKPNYSIVHAHDKDVQEKVGQAIIDTTGIKDWTDFTPSQLSAGLETFYNDQRQTQKKYNDYNVPSAYAIMLTNKGTVPRIYYGDMYQDDGQFMQKKSLYYDDIANLMIARKKYVSGGQSMVDNNGILTSVRYGKGANSVTDIGNSDTRNQGIGLIVGSDPNNNLNDGDTIVLHMGAAHKNQKYRALMLTTEKGIQNYGSDDNAPEAETDNNGDLVFSNKDINGQDNTAFKQVANPEVNGYLAAWVPVGASDDQDARTAPSTSQNNDGNVLHENDALDSNLIFEGFSNFQPTPTNHDEYANVVIAKNAQLFKSWGVTSFEMAPQYKSSQDHTFVDSTIDNGYAFSDRYDVGFGTPTKYGTDEDLRNAIESLHDNGMQVMADVVYNQLYNLPGQEVVSATRAGVTGNTNALPFGTQLYVVNTIGGGDYQKKYGGSFLKQLQEQYPSLFESQNYKYYYKNYANNGAGPGYLTVSDGNRDAIPSDQPITEWSAKYMNGTNILGRGMGYVLKDWNTDAYFKLNGNDSTLPSSLTYKSGWFENQDNTWSYYANDGSGKLTGPQTIDGQKVYFDNNGIQVRGAWVQNPDGTSYYDANSGTILTGDQVVDGKHVKFDENGIMIQDKPVQNNDESKNNNKAKTTSNENLQQNSKTDNQEPSQNKSSTVTEESRTPVDEKTEGNEKSTKLNESPKSVDTDKSSESVKQKNAVNINPTITVKQETAKTNVSKKHDNKASVKKESKVNQRKDSKKKLIAIKKKRLAKTNKAFKDAKKLFAKKKSQKNKKKYEKALKAYHAAEKAFLKLSGTYDSNYFYDFDKLTSKVKVSNNAYLYGSIHFSKKTRIKRIKKGTIVNVKGIVRAGKITRINIGDGHFITASKSFITKFH